MRERHWQKISEDIGLTIPIDDPKFTLTDVLEMGLPSHMEAGTYTRPLFSSA
jgi:hypothetical protein